MNVNTNIKVIETVYKGYKFRSRLEARWAVFFDSLGIEWEYEPEGYVLEDGKWYLPDFWLPESQCFVEIKGIKPNHNEMMKAYLLADIAQYPVFLIQGMIDFVEYDNPYDEGVAYIDRDSTYCFYGSTKKLLGGNAAFGDRCMKKGPMGIIPGSVTISNMFFDDDCEDYYEHYRFDNIYLRNNLSVTKDKAEEYIVSEKDYPILTNSLLNFRRKHSPSIQWNNFNWMLEYGFVEKGYGPFLEHINISDNTYLWGEHYCVRNVRDAVNKAKQYRFEHLK